GRLPAVVWHFVAANGAARCRLVFRWSDLDRRREPFDAAGHDRYGQAQCTEDEPSTGAPAMAEDKRIPSGLPTDLGTFRNDKANGPANITGPRRALAHLGDAAEVDASGHRHEVGHVAR